MIDTILGKRIQMTHVLNEQGKSVPASIIEAGPCIVTRLKSWKSDGYTALQVGFEAIMPQTITSTQLGQFNKSGLPPLRYLREIRIKDTSPYTLGDVITCDIFQPGQHVKITRILIDGCVADKGTGKSESSAMKQVTIRGLRVLSVDSERNLLVIEGPVPDCSRGILTIQLLDQCH